MEKSLILLLKWMHAFLLRMLLCSSAFCTLMLGIHRAVDIRFYRISENLFYLFFFNLYLTFHVYLTLWTWVFFSLLSIGNDKLHQVIEVTDICHRPFVSWLLQQMKATVSFTHHPRWFVLYSNAIAVQTPFKTSTQLLISNCIHRSDPVFTWLWSEVWLTWVISFFKGVGVF